MTDLSDRERELLGAAREFDGACTHETLKKAEIRLSKAIRAYDPPRKRYTMPTWEEFTRPARVGGKGSFGEFILHGKGAIYKEQYESILEALATEEQ